MADNKKSPMPVGGGRGDRHAAPQKPKNTVATLKNYGNIYQFIK